MVDVCACFDDSRAVLRCERVCDQLVEHRLLVLLPRYDAVSMLSIAMTMANIDRVVIWTLNRNPKDSIIVSSVLLLLGNWIRYAGTRASGGHFGVVMFGQIITGLAQPFVLAAPTRYSDLWFTEAGRISATAIPSLANPLGGAVSTSYLHTAID